MSAASQQPTGAVPISKLPQKRKFSSEARENMNCKSCRKRKIKCSRTRPSCNSCEVFRCECIYDAVPKKRGPKTEVLEELLKRIDGLEKRLGESEGSGGGSGDVQAAPGPSREPPLDSPESSSGSGSVAPAGRCDTRSSDERVFREPEPVAIASPVIPSRDNKHAVSSTTTHLSDDTYARIVPRLVGLFFERVNGKPYALFHESMFRRELAEGRVPRYIINTICAVSVRYVPLHELGNKTPQQCSEDFAARARIQVDSDEPTLTNLQSMLLLSLTYYALGYGKKAFMQMGSAIRMTLALDLHRELPLSHPATPLEREVRRRVFWTCYMMDRFTVCGSVRPPCFSDSSICLRLPCTEESFHRGVPSEAPFFNENGQNYAVGSVIQNSTLLVDVVRILGRTIRYTQSGGVKGDSHFPWHAASNLSRIRNELNAWASVRDFRDGVPPTPDATSLFLARGIWHVIYCIMYRNFLPIDLAELDGNGTQQAWQMEATKVCFQHANALVDLISVAAMTPSIEWPAFAGYCLATGASVLVHGVFYRGSEAFRRCKDNFLAVLVQLKALRGIWACMRQQLVVLKKLYLCHEKLVRSYTPDKRPASVFHLDNFFDRYNGEQFEAAHIPFFDAGETDIDLSYISNALSRPAPQQLSLSYQKTTPPQASALPELAPFSTGASGVLDNTYAFSPELGLLSLPFQHSQMHLDVFDFGGTGGFAMYGDQAGDRGAESGVGEQERDPLLNMLAEMAERDGGVADQREKVWISA